MTFLVNDTLAYTGELVVPAFGRWHLTAELEDGAPAPEGEVVVIFGDVVLRGTVLPSMSGEYLNKSKVTIVGGANTWATRLPNRAYHNDAGVTGVEVARDLGRETGERINLDDWGGKDRLGVHFSREEAPAKRILNVLTDGKWWIDYEGVTQTSARPTTLVDCQVLNYDPTTRRAELALDSTDLVRVGGILTDVRLEGAPITSMTIAVTPGGYKCHVTLYDETPDIAGILRRFVREIVAEKFFGVYRYRLIAQASADGRVTAQPVDTSLGLPDVVLVSSWLGSGHDQTPALSSELAVSFFSGDRAQPFVQGFVGADGDNSTPRLLRLDASETIELGGGADFVALAQKVDDNFQTIRDLFFNWTPVPNDGGGALKTLTATPPLLFPSVSADKVKAT